MQHTLHRVVRFQQCPSAWPAAGRFDHAIFTPSLITSLLSTVKGRN
jgi:hypothetical protein